MPLPLDSEAAPTPVGGLRLAVCGTGAVGSELCRLLAERAVAGIASVLLIDPDTLQPGNVTLSRIYGEIAAEAQPGCFTQPKAELLARALGVRSKTSWHTFAGEIADVGWQQLGEADLLVTCPDNALARLEAAQIARALGLPMLDLGVFGGEDDGGRVAWFPPGRGSACYACGLSEDRRAQLLAYAHAPTLGCRLPPDTLPMGTAIERLRSIERVVDCAISLLVRMFPGVKAEVRHPASAFALRLPQRDGAFERIELLRSGTCPFHEPVAGRWLALEPDTPLQAVFPPGEPGLRLQLPWPVCLEARCTRCDTRSTRPQRIALLRRRGVCLQCGGQRTFEPLRTVASLAPDDPLAACTPRQLGLASRHLLLLRPAFHPGAPAHP